MKWMWESERFECVCVCVCVCVGEKLPDMTGEQEKQYQDELNRVHRVFGGGDMTKFPEFNFVDKTPPEEH